MTAPQTDDNEVPPMPSLFGPTGQWVGLTESESMLLADYQFEIYERVHRASLACEAAEKRLAEATAELHRLVAEQRAVETQLLNVKRPSHTDLVREMIANRFN